MCVIFSLKQTEDFLGGGFGNDQCLVSVYLYYINTTYIDDKHNPDWPHGGAAAQHAAVRCLENCEACPVVVGCSSRVYKLLNNTAFAC